MAQGAIDLFLKSRNPVYTKKEKVPDDGGSSEFVLDSDSTVMSSEEIEQINGFDDSDVITDVDLSFNNNSSKQEEQKEDVVVEKVKVKDIFKSLGQKSKQQDSYVKEDVVDEGIIKEDNEHSSSTEPDPFFDDDEPIILIDSPSPKRKSRVSAVDILIGKKKKISQPVLEDTATSDDTEGADVISDNDNEEEDIICLNSEDFLGVSQPDQPKVNPRDLLTGKRKQDEDLIEILSDDDSISVKSKRKKNSKQNKPKLLVMFKYKTHEKKIMELEQKMKNSMGRSVNTREFLGGFKKPKSENESNSENNNNQNHTSLSSSLRNPNIIRKNPISKLKDIELPELTKVQIHVKGEEPTIDHRSLSLNLRPELIREAINYNEIPFQNPSNEVVNSSLFQFSKFESELTTYEIAKSKISNIENHFYFKRFAKLLKHGNEVNSNDVWTSSFKPLTSDDILIDSETVFAMKKWLSNSFNILKKTTKRPDFKKNRKQKDDDMMDFIVDDYDSEGTEDGEYVPLMVIHGPAGVGKTSAVYALVEELNGYIHEINASQNRSRKDILGSLKELSTTQMVHQNQEQIGSNEFQKGVILFEDVDILFEQDKGFWSVVQNLLTISRRPIIMTCSELNCIPSEILDLGIREKSVFEFEKQDFKLLKNYLFLVALTHRILIDEDPLNKILIDNDFDLRKSLNSLQFLFKPLNTGEGLTRIELRKKKQQREELKDISDLKKYASIMEIQSITEVIEFNQHSLLNSQMEVEFDYTDLSLVDDTTKEEPLYFEFDFVRKIQEYLPKFPYDRYVLDKHELISIDREFYKTKLKQSNRLTRRMISSAAIKEFVDDTYDNEVFDLLPSNTFITEVSPIMREFARNDLNTQIRNKEILDHDTAKRPMVDLIHDGLVFKTKFSGNPRTLLTGPMKWWSEE